LMRVDSLAQSPIKGWTRGWRGRLGKPIDTVGAEHHYGREPKRKRGRGTYWGEIHPELAV